RDTVSMPEPQTATSGSVSGRRRSSMSGIHLVGAKPQEGAHDAVHPASGKRSEKDKPQIRAFGSNIAGTRPARGDGALHRVRDHVGLDGLTIGQRLDCIGTSINGCIGGSVATILF